MIEENLEIQKQTKLANDDARHQKSVIESLTLTLNELQKHHNKLESYFKRKQSQRHQRQIAESELNLAIDSFTSLI